MRISRRIVFMGGACLAVLLAACSSSNSTVLSPSERVAEAGEAVIEERTGERLLLECPADLAFEEGSTVSCALTDQATAQRFMTLVTLEEIDGDDLTVTVQVTNTPVDSDTPQSR